MADPVYVSKVRIDRRAGPLRVAYLPGESQPIYFSVHGIYAMRCPLYRTLHNAIQMTSSITLVSPAAIS